MWRANHGLFPAPLVSFVTALAILNPWPAGTSFCGSEGSLLGYNHVIYGLFPFKEMSIGTAVANTKYPDTNANYFE